MRNWPFSSKTSFVRVGNTTRYWTASSFGSVPVSMPTDQGSSWRTHLVAMMTYVKWNNNQSWPVMASSTTLQVLWSASVVPSSNHRQRLNLPNHRLISLSLILSSRRRLSAFFQVNLWLKQAHDALWFVMLLVGWFPEKNNGQSGFAIQTFYWRIAVRMYNCDWCWWGWSQRWQTIDIDWLLGVTPRQAISVIHLIIALMMI